ncbi:MAG: hypothetical protein MUE36_06005 [Acidimicrobiales bacterium]|jgi:hypothetical protein|nr:hypothetical protein [Acidimicrobiales bacterium]
MTMVSRAWMLDPVEFHLDLEARRRRGDGTLAWRDEAVLVWEQPDPVVRSYLELLPLSDPEDWLLAPEPGHLVEWYRVLMAPYLIPTRAFRSPDLMRRRFPDLGWPPSEARRLARGRELLDLAASFAPDAVVAELSPLMRLGNKGWLHDDDIAAGLERMRRLERGAFRHHQDLVPVVENAFEVLEAAATKPDHIFLSITD